jgi:hypothetical protein
MSFVIMVAVVGIVVRVIHIVTHMMVFLVVAFFLLIVIVRESGRQRENQSSHQSKFHRTPRFNMNSIAVFPGHADARSAAVHLYYIHTVSCSDGSAPTFSVAAKKKLTKHRGSSRAQLSGVSGGDGDGESDPDDSPPAPGSAYQHRDFNLSEIVVEPISRSAPVAAEKFRAESSVLNDVSSPSVFPLHSSASRDRSSREQQ